MQCNLDSSDRDKTKFREPPRSFLNARRHTTATDHSQLASCKKETRVCALASKVHVGRLPPSLLFSTSVVHVSYARLYVERDRSQIYRRGLPLSTNLRAESRASERDQQNLFGFIISPSYFMRIRQAATTLHLPPKKKGY